MAMDNVSTREEATALYAGVDALVKQLKDLAPPVHDPKIDQLVDEGKWIDWVELRTKVDAYASRTLEEVRALRPSRRGSSSATSIKLAMRLNTAMFGLIFAGGIDCGPPRPFLMKSLVLKGVKGCEGPADDETFCSVCPAARPCRGNVLEKDDSGDFVLCITHHKMGNKIKKAIPPISIRKASNHLAWAVTEEVFAWGHKALVESYYGDTSQLSFVQRQALFRKSESGEPFRVEDPQENAPSMYVAKMVADLMGVSRQDLHITGNMLRRMYITWSKSGADALTREEQEGAAIAMGTSVEMFQKVYDPTHRRTLVESAQSKARRRFQQEVVEAVQQAPSVSSTSLTDHVVTYSICAYPSLA